MTDTQRETWDSLRAYLEAHIDDSFRVMGGPQTGVSMTARELLAEPQVLVYSAARPDHIALDVLAFPAVILDGVLVCMPRDWTPVPTLIRPLPYDVPLMTRRPRPADVPA